MTVHGCTVRSPPTGCQVASRPRYRFSRYSKWLDTLRTALVGSTLLRSFRNFRANLFTCVVKERKRPHADPRPLCKPENSYYLDQSKVNRSKPELSPICYLLALLTHHFLDVSRIRVNSLTFRRLMSYIYMEHPFLMFLDHTQRRSTVGRTPLDE